MSEPINNPTPAPVPEPAPERTFTQAEVDTLIGKRLAKAMKGMPSEEELTAFRTWKDGQAGEKERWENLIGERDTLSGKLTAAEAERDQLKRNLYPVSYTHLVTYRGGDGGSGIWNRQIP